MLQNAYSRNVLAYDVKARTWETLYLSDTFGNTEERYCVALIVCNSNLMMIVQAGEHPEVNCLWELRVDLELHQLSKVFRCPPRFLKIRSFMTSPASSDGRSIFLGYDDCDGKLVARKVGEVVLYLKRSTKR
jgi:hypothetical protein